MPQILLTCHRRSAAHDVNLNAVNLRVTRYEVNAVYGFTTSGPAPAFVPVAAEKFDLAEHPELGDLLNPDGISWDAWEVAIFVQALEDTDIDEAGVTWLIDMESAEIA